MSWPARGDNEVVEKEIPQEVVDLWGEIINQEIADVLCFKMGGRSRMTWSPFYHQILDLLCTVHNGYSPMHIQMMAA